jgi:hypothetical protein
MELFGIELLGFTAENGRKLLISIVLVGGLIVANLILRYLLTSFFACNRTKTVRFWVRQVWHLEDPSLAPRVY